MQIELNEQQTDFLKFLIEENVLSGQITYSENAKGIAQQIINKLESNE